MGSEPALGFVLLKCFIPGVLVSSPGVSDRQLGANIGALWVKKCLVDTPSEFWGLSKSRTPHPWRFIPFWEAVGLP